MKMSIPVPNPIQPQTAPGVHDESLVKRIVQGDQAAFEALMRRHNSRLYRVARAILKNESEAEDALQDAYLDAYRHIGEFRGNSAVGTWLTRIVVNHALMRVRKHKRDRVVVPFGDSASSDVTPAEAEVADDTSEPPPMTVIRGEIRRMLERRIDELPVAFRTVFVMRDVEDMTVEETAACLAIPPATVRTRLFRARALLRAALAREMDTETLNVFSFEGDRCDRIVAKVLPQL